MRGRGRLGGGATLSAYQPRGFLRQAGGRRGWGGGCGEGQGGRNVCCRAGCDCDRKVFWADFGQFGQGFEGGSRARLVGELVGALSELKLAGEGKAEGNAEENREEDAEAKGADVSKIALAQEAVGRAKEQLSTLVRRFKAVAEEEEALRQKLASLESLEEENAMLREIVEGEAEAGAGAGEGADGAAGAEAELAEAEARLAEAEARAEGERVRRGCGTTRSRLRWRLRWGS
ncbi:hypothetical protein CLOP_g21810 [Closterium sp. NIES-67]|nr:hypothetical protein CLOP_g21810 [Closterium sp. NIES-67]